MVRLRLAIDVSGACLARGVNNAGERVEAYKENPTGTDRLEIEVADNTEVAIYVKSPGYYVYEGRYTPSSGTQAHTEIVTLEADTNIPRISANPSRQVELVYDGQDYGYIEYGYGLDDPDIAAVTIDSLFSSEAGLKLIADYSTWGLNTNIVENESYRHAESDIIVDPEVGDIVSVAYHDGRFYIVGKHADDTDHLYRYINTTDGLVLDADWDNNPINVPTTVTGKDVLSGGMEVWNGHIYIADQDNVGSITNSNKSWNVYKVSNGEHLGIWTPQIPAALTDLGGHFPSGICTDEQRNRMILFYYTSSGTISSLYTSLQEFWYDRTGHLKNTTETMTLPLGSNNSDRRVHGTIDDDGVMYMGAGERKVSIINMDNDTEIPQLSFRTQHTFTDLTIYKGVVLIAVRNGTNRGLRAYALRNKRFPNGSRMEQVRHPEGGQNPFGSAPYRITDDGIFIDFDFLRIVPNVNTHVWEMRPLNAPILSRYGGQHLPTYTDDGRVQLCSVPLSKEQEIDLSEITDKVDKLKSELPFAIWDYRFDPSKFPKGTRLISRGHSAWYLKEAKEQVDTVNTNVDTIHASNREIQTETGAIKAQTDKLKYNATNEVIIDDETINAEITTVVNGQANLERSIENNTNYLRPMQDTLNKVEQDIQPVKDSVELDEILITESNAQATEKADAVGYALVDADGNQKYRKKTRTSADASTKPTDHNAVKFKREVV